MLLSACEPESSLGPEPDPVKDSPAPVITDKVGMVFDNHQHDALLTKAQLEAGTEVLLHIQGHSQHDHYLTLTREDLAAIRSGLTVSKPSTTDWGHQHLILFNRTA